MAQDIAQVEDWINVEAAENKGWTARWNAWMLRLVRYLRALDQSYSYTPQLTQNGANVNSTLLVAEYVRIGNTIHGYVYLTANGAGTVATLIGCSAPLARRPAGNVAVGSGYFAAGGATYPIEVYLGGGSTFNFIHTNALSSFLGTGAFAGALAVGHVLSFHFTYAV